MMKIAACDGNPSYDGRLVKILCEWERDRGQGIEYIHTRDSSDLIDLCSKNGHMDLIFMALQPARGPDGFTAAQSLKETEDNLRIVFVTAERQVDIELLSLQPLGILPLPLEAHGVRYFADRCSEFRKKCFIIKQDRFIRAIPVYRICYISKKDHPDHREINIYCSDGNIYTSYMSMKEVEAELLRTGADFLRIHISCFVNPFFVETMSRTEVLLFKGFCSGENRLFCSRSYGSRAYKKYLEYLKRHIYANGIDKYTY